MYKDSIIQSGLPICNSLGLQNPLTLIYKEGNTPALETNDENLFWIPSPITKYAYNKVSLSNEVACRMKTLNDVYTEAKLKLEPISSLSVLEGINLVHPFRWYAYGHLHDSLTRLYNMKDLCYDKDKIMYVVADPLRIRCFMDHLSALTGHTVAEEQLVNIGRYSQVTIDRLWHPLPPSTPTNYTKECYRWVLDSYFTYFDIHDAEPLSCLYLSRNHVTNSRQVINEEEVLDFLAPKGFIVVTGNEPLADIVRLFSNAKLVVGAHGSLFANTIFCPNQCRIIEFCPSNRIDRSIQLKYKQATHYSQIALQADNHFNISIPIHSLKELVCD